MIAADFDAYWQGTLAELAGTAPATEVEPIPSRSSDASTVYGVHLTSVGPYRLFAYLSVSNGEPPFPAVFHLPKYASVVNPFPQGESNATRGDSVVFSLGARGLRNADRPFVAQFPGLLTEGIDDAATYVFRGIVADCVRGVEYLAGRPEVDGTRIAAVGDDYALMAASLTNAITHLVCTPQLFFDSLKTARSTTAYPLEELNDYLRLYPKKAGKVGKTLSYFDLRGFAPSVKATTLLIGGAPGEALDRPTLQPLMSGLAGEVTFYETAHSVYKDGAYVREWLAGQLA